MHRQEIFPREKNFRVVTKFFCDTFRLRSKRAIVTTEYFRHRVVAMKSEKGKNAVDATDYSFD